MFLWTSIERTWKAKAHVGNASYGRASGKNILVPLQTSWEFTWQEEAKALLNCRAQAARLTNFRCAGAAEELPVASKATSTLQKGVFRKKGCVYK